MPRGGEFLLIDLKSTSAFTPEDFSDEHRMVFRMADEFVQREVEPNIDRIEKLDLELTVRLLKKAGEVGLLGIEVPEKYGGLGLDKVSATLVAERIGATGSFAVSFGGHVGIGTLPLVYFGSVPLKEKYLPKLASGELLAAYALTEPSAGSDAMNIRTKAVLAPDGTHYLLTGTKVWITNSGFADVFNVFAKVDGEKFTCFLVERQYPGLSTGAEEKKMGLHGSSTRVVNLDSVPVPVENIIGEIGKGHKVAFNILNFGRFKLGASCVGASKRTTDLAIGYASQRVQFGRPIASFGAIKEKLAEMAIRTWVGESMVYRTVGLIDKALQGVDVDNTEEALARIEQYAIECSIIKVAGSEILDYVVDEAVQVYGGYGYSAEYPVERAYRDSRINRIFEGTNEINRLLISGTLLRRSLKGELGILAEAMRLAGDITSPSLAAEPETGILGEETAAAQNAKRLAVLLLGLAAQTYMDKVSEEQEILMAISDIVLHAYAMESAVLRATKLAVTRGESAAELQLEATRAFVTQAMGWTELSARKALAAMAQGDTLRTYLSVLRRLARHTPANMVAIRRRIADSLIDAGRYNLS
jgi:alkylation response protein AidB-like acyl-CoA dehydrogenase